MSVRHSVPQAAASSSSAAAFTSSSRTPLYRDALGCVLGFLSLRELAAALAVNQEWAAAVQSMRPAMLLADITAVNVPALMSSRLRRHVGELGQDEDPKLCLSSNNLSALSHALPYLLSLNAHVQPSDVPLLFPARLQRLDMRVWQTPSSQQDLTTGLLAAIDQLQQLHTLRLECCGWRMSLAPLQKLPLLRDLELIISFPNPEQSAKELRALPWLHRLCIGDVDGTQVQRAALLHALLGHAPEEELRTLQWRDFAFGVRLTDELTRLLLRLPSSLERLEVDLSLCTRFYFLAALPRLTDLELHAWDIKDDAWTNLLGVFTAGGLSRLHALCLRGCLCTDGDLLKLLSHTPSLTSLELVGLRKVGSLSFFHHLPKLAETLTNLTLDCGYAWLLTAVDLPHLLFLQQLRTLRLLYWPSEEPHVLTAAERAPFQRRPCVVLPHLAVFEWTVSG
jgi:hypothetical protein